jgi:hypothetical protein
MVKYISESYIILNLNESQYKVLETKIEAFAKLHIGLLLITFDKRFISNPLLFPAESSPSPTFRKHIRHYGKRCVVHPDEYRES